MQKTLFTVTGCTRCKIVKRYMEEHNVSYVEKDIKVDGKEEFQAFYKANRNAIYRGPDGIEFPVLTDACEIRQGIGVILAYLHFGKNLDGFFTVGSLHGEWIDGIHISGGNPDYASDFIEVLRYLKNNNFKLQLDTNGMNSVILEQVLMEGLGDAVVMQVIGPVGLYSLILGKEVDADDIKKSIVLTSRFPRYRFETTIVPVIRGEGETKETGYLTPEEVAEVAKLIEEATGSKKQPYFIRVLPGSLTDEKMLFAYKRAARDYQVFTEVERN